LFVESKTSYKNKVPSVFGKSTAHFIEWVYQWRNLVQVLVFTVKIEGDYK